MNIPLEAAKRQLPGFIERVTGRQLTESEQKEAKGYVDMLLNAAVDQLNQTVNLQQQEINELQNRLEEVESECNASIQRLTDEMNRLTS